MTTRFHRWVVLLVGLVVLPAVGCVERHYIITTDPPDAIIECRGKWLGASPTDMPFTYYAKERFTAQKEGYEITVHEEQIKAPWYEWTGLDFISENLIPFNIKDVRRIHIHMEPVRILPPDQIYPRAQELRAKGKAIETPPLPPPKEQPPGPPPMTSPPN